MIHLVTSANQHLYTAQLWAMHRARRTQFVERNGWRDLTVFAGGEFDDYDDEQALYLLDLGERGEVQAGARIRPARTMLAGAVAWFSLNLVFSWLCDPLLGEVVLFVAGFAQSFCMIPMAVLLLRVADPQFRGRVMGVRMLAVYGMPVGLLLSGPLVERVGFSVTGSLFSLVGIFFTLIIAFYWRAHLWHPAAGANVR